MKSKKFRSKYEWKDRVFHFMRENHINSVRTAILFNGPSPAQMAEKLQSNAESILKNYNKKV